MKQFKIQIPAQEIEYLNQRLSNTRWPGETINEGWKKGVPTDYLKKLADYWRHQFDWKKQEALLNQYPQFITEIDGQNIHFLHIRSGDPNATPLMLIHGWPGSFADFVNVIEPLTNPPADKGTGSFHLVIPSIPGFGFSTPVKEKGWNMFRIAAAFSTLMENLGYSKFAVHGGDMGAGIASIMAAVAAHKLTGTHINTDFYSVAGLGMFPSDTSFLSDEEKPRLERMKEYKKNGTAYLEIQSTRPQTIAYSLSDSPVGQLAWIVEKYKEWTDEDKELPENAISIDQILTNVSLYWFNKNGASSADVLYENMSMAFNWGSEGSQASSQWTPPKVRSAVTVFGKNADKTLFKKLLSFTGEPDHYIFHEKGGHFPAMEVPDLLVKDLREVFGQGGS
ncbi:alpha/beta hydrolase [Fulvivirgaceae bacterium PWU4]|uniref:Alpha/beta hydrolase n=1 Tax=Chryseosolibacter histidini TaxID=2782349 RepID=A0AAP2DKM3_9BACT|nr:epoxide hydrolase [Chryseosolibacter histidini]MBT1696717.1 alpha/beta hydrolase [Chryseosolibacter histidini]